MNETPVNAICFCKYHPPPFIMTRNGIWLGTLVISLYFQNMPGCFSLDRDVRNEREESL